MLKADKDMKDTINNIIVNGCKMENAVSRYVDGSIANTIYVVGSFYRYDISRNEFPITTLRPIPIKKAIGEILWIYQDQSNDLDLLRDKYGITWWDKWAIKGERNIGCVYGETVRRHDLVNKLLYDIISHPYERRHIINLWQDEDFTHPHGLKPCCFQTQFTVRGKYLDMILYQRSSDWLTAGNINQMQYVAFQMMVARHCGYEPGVFMHMIGNQHIYSRHLENARIMMFREPIDCSPILVLNPDKKDFYSFEVSDFTLYGYKAVTPQLNFEVAVHSDQDSPDFLS